MASWDTDITSLLRAHRSGDPEAVERLLPLVYGELRRIARRRLWRERASHTLDPTELVHEAFLKLSPAGRVDWRSRSHFYAVASRAMRQVLVDHAARRGAAKRGGGVVPRSLDERVAASVPALDELLALEGALKRLEAEAPRQVRVVECRYFGGLTLEETAAALSLSPATVSRDWTLARAWLHRELIGTPPATG